MADIERVVMSGVTHWHSPRFHAYFPTGNSYPAIVADMLSGAIACIGFTWIASPACTELEFVMMDWLGQMIGLPESFLARSGGEAGGVIQGSASEATLVALLGAKSRVMVRTKEQHPEWKETYILGKLVGYCNRIQVQGCLFHFVQALLRRARHEGIRVGRNSPGWQLVQLYVTLALLLAAEVPLGLAELPAIAAQESLHFNEAFHGYFGNQWMTRICKAI